MATQAQTSPHLAAARKLLDEISAADGADPQVKATAAAAHATLVLAEQVAAVRLVMAAGAVENGKVPRASHPGASLRPRGSSRRPRASPRAPRAPARARRRARRASSRDRAVLARQCGAQQVLELDPVVPARLRGLHRLGEQGAQAAVSRTPGGAGSSASRHASSETPAVASAAAARRSPARRMPRTTCSGASAGAPSDFASAPAYSTARRTSGLGSTPEPRRRLERWRNRRCTAWRVTPSALAMLPKERPAVSARATCWRSNSSTSRRSFVSVFSAASGSGSSAASSASRQIVCPETDMRG